MEWPEAQRLTPTSELRILFEDYAEVEAAN
jgi:hypothetical protein